MANDLVVTLGARLDQFASDMNQAGDIADSAVSKIEQSFANLNPGINMASLSTAIAAGVVGFSALLAAVTALNIGLDDMAKQAERVGLSVERFQQLQFGAAALGISSKQFGADMEAFTTNAQKAVTTTNDLKRVMDANGVSVTNAAGKLKDVNTLFQQSVDILKRAPTIADALQMGQFLGLSKEFSQAIFDAGDNFLKMAASANAAGAVIDSATIQKAHEFTTEWNKASALWGAQMKAATLEFLPLINDAIAAARTLMSYVSTALQGLSAVKDFALPPDVDTASLAKLQSMYEVASKIYDKLEQGQKLNPIELFSASNMQENGEVTLATVNKYLALIADRILNFNKDPALRITIPVANPSVNPGVKQADSTSAYERETEAIEKHTLKMTADAATVGESVDKQEEYRVQLQLTEAVLKDGTEWTSKLNDEIALTAQRAGEAKLQLAQHEFALQKLNTASQAVGSALSTAFADAIVEGKKFSDVMTSLVQTLEKAAINQLVMQFFTTPAGGGTSIFATALKGIGLFAGGTDYAPGGMALVGEQGPELVNLPRGSQVIPNDAIGNAGGGGSVSAPVVFNVDNRGASVDAVARMGQIMTQMQAELPGRIVATIQQARRGRVPGV